ncbi:hypothetical protein H8S44_05300 [Anaerosacchariphilus sp. NSJ-68]|uniref:Uncharacterized protein n=2 Tax=Lachnospiraceae TaxID=186803 RepID=A0A923RNA2_9FIRM|nr:MULTISPECIES: hypothetical protein [Lachnospiraceae]MBC5659185.1 hypothetical protein [Anaerosacchariphilus hominis]MBC5696851.1 hypothetical protein [Roseburia difficilis]
MQNQFLGFANQIIAQHTQTGGPFDSAAMIFPEPEEQTDGETVRNSYVTNLYRMQNLTQENYLYQNQLHFVTQILEKQFYQKVYPTVEEQVEKLVRQELPETEERLIRQMTKEVHRLVQEGGTEQLTLLKERLERENEVKRDVQKDTEKVVEKEVREVQLKENIIKENTIKENTIKEKQMVLLRKIENIYQSSQYRSHQTHQTHVTVQTGPDMGKKDPARLERLLIRTERLVDASAGQLPASLLYEREGKTAEQTKEQIKEEIKEQTEGSFVPRRESVRRTMDGETGRSYPVEHPELVRGSYEPDRRTESGMESPAKRVFAVRPQPEQLFTQGLPMERAGERMMQRTAAELVYEERAEAGEAALDRETRKIEGSDERQLEAAVQSAVKQAEREIRTEAGPAERQPRTEVEKKAADQREAAEKAVQRVQTEAVEKAARQAQTEAIERAVRQTRAEAENTEKVARQAQTEAIERAVRQTRAEAENTEKAVRQAQAEKVQTVVEQTLTEMIQGEAGAAVNPSRRAVEALPWSREPKITEQSGFEPASMILPEPETSPEASAPGELHVPAQTSETGPQRAEAAHPERISAAQKQTGRYPASSVEQLVRRAESLKRFQSSGLQSFQSLWQLPGAELFYSMTEASGLQGQNPFDQQSRTPAFQPVSVPVGQAERAWFQPIFLGAAQDSFHQDSFRQGSFHQDNFRQNSSAQDGFIPGSSVQSSPNQMEAVPFRTAQTRFAQNSSVQSLAQPRFAKTQAARLSAMQFLQTLPMRSPDFALDTASMVYPEEEQTPEQEETRRMQEQIQNVTEELKTVRRSVRTEETVTIERQREVVREVLKKEPELLAESTLQARLGQQVHREVESRMEESIQQMADRVYRKLEQKLRTERERRGRI